MEYLLPTLTALPSDLSIKERILRYIALLFPTTTDEPTYGGGGQIFSSLNDPVTYSAEKVRELVEELTKHKYEKKEGVVLKNNYLNDILFKENKKQDFFSTKYFDNDLYISGKKEITSRDIEDDMLHIEKKLKEKYDFDPPKKKSKWENER